MVYNRYYLGIWIRVILLTLVISLLWWTIWNTSRFYTWLFLGGVALFQVFEMVQYQNRINLYLSRFLINLRERSLSFRINPDNNSKTFKDLSGILTEIQQIVFKANLEREKQFHYLNYVVSNLDVGVITFYSSGKTELCNPAALHVLGLQKLTHINELNAINPGFSQFIDSLKGGQQRMRRVNIGNKVKNLSFRCGEFRIQSMEMKLVSFQDIHTELEENELDAWQKLIRVLTHEIMNSITPVNTLAQSMIRQIKKDNRVIEVNEVDSEKLSELIDGLEMIEERGTGVLEFVEKFRSLTRIPVPHFSDIVVENLIRRIVKLFSSELEKNNVKIRYTPNQENLMLLADEKLLVQSLINIVKNSLESLAGRTDGDIVISSGVNEEHRTYIAVSDNGCGIEPDDLDKVFVPFFTTKENGSGIGLSITREVMRLHKGNVHIYQKPEGGTTILLLF